MTQRTWWDLFILRPQIPLRMRLHIIHCLELHLGYFHLATETEPCLRNLTGADKVTGLGFILHLNGS